MTTAVLHQFQIRTFAVGCRAKGRRIRTWTITADTAANAEAEAVTLARAAAGYQHLGMAPPSKAPSGGSINSGGAQGRLF